MTRAGSREPGKNVTPRNCSYDVWVAEGAHQLTFPHELGSCSADLSRWDLGAVQEYVVDLFGGADGSRHGHLLHGTIRSCTDFDTGRSDVGEHERPQLGVLGEKACGGHSTSELGGWITLQTSRKKKNH